MKGVGYVRASTIEQKITLRHQESKIRAYAKAKSITLVEVVVDSGESGKNLDRPGVQRVLEMVNNKEVKAVIIYKIDRMFRSTTDALNIAESFKEKGIAFHSICESIDTASPWGKFFYTLVNAFAELERNVISERVRAAKAYLKESGKIHCRDLYGYDKDMVNKVFIKNLEEQKAINLMLFLRENGCSYQTIAQELNLKSIKTKRGSIWAAKQVREVILREGGF